MAFSDIYKKNKLTDFAETVFFNSLIVLEVPGQVRSTAGSPKVRLKGPDAADGSETHSTTLSQADMPLMVALLAVIPVKSRRCAAEIHPVRIIRQGDRSKLV